MRGACALGLALAAGPAPAETGAEPRHGSRAADPARCAFAGRIGSHDPAPVEFPAQGVRGLGTSCAVAEAVADDENSFHIVTGVVTGVCAGEGMTWPQVDLLMPGGDGAMWRWMGQGEPIGLTRCKGE